MKFMNVGRLEMLLRQSKPSCGRRIMDREAIEEAIEVLEDASAEMLMETGNENYYGEAITALRQALEPEQEPVLWLKTWSDGSVSVLKTKSHAFADHELESLYTAPPKKQWVGLTLNEAEDFYDKYTDRAELINAVDKFLEEKNRG
jgi:hypothetical protein